nr:glycosyltransferase family 2 protein [Brucella intermedia]
MNNFDSITDQSVVKQLTISIVTFEPDLLLLQETLDSLIAAIKRCNNLSFLITIVDNSANDIVEKFLQLNYSSPTIRLIRGQGNVGFGRGHNLSLDEVGEFHLILNPDIKLDENAIVNALEFMTINPTCGLITPSATWPSGERQYLCKRYPAVFDLLLRGFMPAAIRSFFIKRLAEYEMQAETQDHVYWSPLIVSGCFMFYRTNVLQRTNGFCENYFLYFEDFDLSLRTHRHGRIVYVPSVKVVHAGGNASAKGLLHIRMFLWSAIIFYKSHGLKII